MGDVRINIRLSEKEKANINKLAERNNMTESEYIIYRTLTINPQNPDNTNKKYSYELPNNDRHEYILANLTIQTRIMLEHFLKLSIAPENCETILDRIKKESFTKLKEYKYSKIKNED